MISKENIRVIKGDITKESVDAIVNAANSSLMGGSGVDGAIHRAGGKRILEECMEIISRQGKCQTGEAVITSGGNLPAKYVIHTVGPVWNGGNNQERQKLKNCYNNSLELALKHGIQSIAFPNISTGIYRFPKEEAAGIAFTTVKNFLEVTPSPVDVTFICYDDENFALYQKLHQQLPDH
ncbi:O-acetyl-ADP-ribose deacetylase [Pararcticibacter amylolyticus]|uniref:O-acetyl-ADP-ribose deacetylase n=1 Tax=Pararcticibacter amylolyticus TaxID=2173175 RepID=A0A2U2PGT8_9SPHI|nr:O-acetyl-ADP-ribose deacetylase [Pararcticibacter amylolyticus]PWG80462.1 O-acetyl-ADP-ribose deacetylase [Pararcticibacter amylolyticus]